MPCPFPGMDPYLEDPAVWPGLHDSLIVYTRDALQPLILPRYYVEIRERKLAPTVGRGAEAPLRATE